MTGRPATAAARVCAGLWLVDPSGRSRHAALDWQPTLLSVSGRSVLLAAATDGRVELRTAAARLLKARAVAGIVRAIALSTTIAAVLVERTSGDEIDVYDSRLARLRGRFGVPASTSAELATAGDAIVFRVGRSIHVVDVTRRKQRVVAVAASRPVGLGIEGRRIAWAENLGKESLIRSIVLPPQ
jgi:hypothetical protein